MIIEAVLLGFFLGFIRNGRLNNFADMRFRGGILIIVGFIVYIMPYCLGILGIDFEPMQALPFLASLVALVVAIFNFEKSGIKLITLGGLLNIVIMGLNDFRMPVSFEKMASHGLSSLVTSMNEGGILNYIDMSKAHMLSPYLGKIILMPTWYPFSQLISIGDLIMSIGIVFLVQGEMMMFSSKRGSMITFQYHSNR